MASKKPKKESRCAAVCISVCRSICSPSQIIFKAGALYTGKHKGILPHHHHAWGTAPMWGQCRRLILYICQQCPNNAQHQDNWEPAFMLFMLSDSSKVLLCDFLTLKVKKKILRDSKCQINTTMLMEITVLLIKIPVNINLSKIYCQVNFCVSTKLGLRESK